MTQGKKYNVTLDVQKGTKVFSPGATVINDAWISKDNVRVPTPVKLAQGEQFQVVVDFEAHNAIGGTINNWSVCVTVIDATKDTYNYAHLNSILSIPPSEIASHQATLDRMGPNVMPAHDLTLHVRIFGADGLTPSPLYPDVSLWW